MVESTSELRIGLERLAARVGQEPSLAVDWEEIAYDLEGMLKFARAQEAKIIEANKVEDRLKWMMDGSNKSTAPTVYPGNVRAGEWSFPNPGKRG